jgi:hypothetical protein
MTSVSQTVRASSGVSAQVQVEYVPEKSETEVACQCKIAQTGKKCQLSVSGGLQLWRNCFRRVSKSVRTLHTQL